MFFVFLLVNTAWNVPRDGVKQFCIKQFVSASIGVLLLNYLSCKGRQMIEHTKKLVEEKFTTLGGYEHNAEVNNLNSFVLFV